MPNPTDPIAPALALAQLDTDIDVAVHALSSMSLAQLHAVFDRSAMMQPITPGAHVTFDSEHGPQRGTVAEIRADLGNGQRIALISVPGTLDGAPWCLPVEQLRCVAA